MPKLLLSKSYNILIFSCLILLTSSCAQKKGFALRSLKRQTLIFNVGHIGGPAGENILHNNLTYKFEKNNTYKSYFDDGSFFEAGDYSYLKIKLNKGRLVLSYTMSDQVYIYEMIMKFKTSSEGIWSGSAPRNPQESKKEYGTFRIIN